MTDEPDNPEVFIREGGVWIPDGKALCDKIGASYLYFDEGELYAGVSGQGDFLVRDLLAEKDAPVKPLAALRTIK